MEAIKISCLLQFATAQNHIKLFLFASIYVQLEKKYDTVYTHNDLIDKTLISALYFSTFKGARIIVAVFVIIVSRLSTFFVVA